MRGRASCRRTVDESRSGVEGRVAGVDAYEIGYTRDPVFMPPGLNGYRFRLPKLVGEAVAMHRALGIVVVLLATCFARDSRATLLEASPRSGDLVFHTSSSSQSEAIGLATGSTLTHVGLVVVRDGRPWVLEASRRVTYTPLEQFVRRGVGGRASVYRPSAAVFSDPDLAERLSGAAAPRIGRAYDTTFEWTKERMYCSELVYLVVRDATGVELGSPEPFANLDLTSAPVRRLIARRFGRGALPTGLVLTPVAISRDRGLTYLGELVAP